MTNAISDFSGKTVGVDLGERSYPIYIGKEIFNRFAEVFIHHCGRKKAVIVTDFNVGPLYAGKLRDCLSDNTIATSVMTINAGESSKCMPIVENIYDFLFNEEMERSDAVIALGGGVVGDLAGFAAATYKRGIQYVQFPTTLLAMVDSSIGGKTGINHPRGKNMIGAFYQPKFVYAEVDTLNTLPRRELGCGLAETVKHGMIRDTAFFELIEKKTDRILSLDSETMTDLVLRNCRIKAEVVSADEKESGLRGILNLGHTIGHVFETVLHEHDFHHGEAVSLGMAAAARLAVHRGFLREKDSKRMLELLKRLALPVCVKEHLATHQDSIPPLSELPIDAMYNAMKQDKKVKDGRITFVLPTKIGDCTFVNDLTEDEIKKSIESLYE